MNFFARYRSHSLFPGFLMLVGALLLIFRVIAPATAGVNVTLNLPRTGQSSCYNTAGDPISCAGSGQDGDYRAGVPWPSPRFQDNHDNTLTDNLTGLMWTQDADTPGAFVYSCSVTNYTVTWQQALNHIACLNSHNYLGHSDWRLPNANEMESLRNSEAADNANWLETQGVVNVFGAYWTSTTSANSAFPDGKWAYEINWGMGLVIPRLKTDTSDYPHVWPVRGATHGTAPLWKTGQTTSYATGDDGDLQTGVAWPQPRFEVQDGCVTDRLTGLVWTQNADRLTGVQDWQAALNYAAGLNLCGFDDWRLPNRKELFSLLNPAVVTMTTWLESQGFSNVRDAGPGGSYPPYWSSTSYPYNPAAAFGLRMDGSFIGTFMKSLNLAIGGYVWPVRGGSVGPVILPTDTPIPTPTPSPTATPRPSPVISSVLPAGGKADVAGSLQISGANFKPGVVVSLHTGQALSTTFQSSALLNVHLPALPAGTYNFKVTNADGPYSWKNAAYTAYGAAVDDLYGYAYELVPVAQPIYAGQATTLFFTVYRRGGSSPLSNVKVRFYNGDPQAGGTLLGSGSILQLNQNGFFAASTAWTPASAGEYTLYAVIDPQNQVAEADESNNIYHATLTVAGLPQDTTPPQVDSFSGPLTVYQPSATFNLSASDDAGGVLWMDFVIWEISVVSGDWIVMDDTGWLPYRSTYQLTFWDWPGPRWVQVYVADGADNVSNPKEWVVNYVSGDDFLFTGESRLYLYPLLTGETLSANLTPTWPDPDLYIWPPDYPTHDYWVSANDGAASESLNATAFQDGFYWLEVYAYADWPSFRLTAGVSHQADARTASWLTTKPKRSASPVAVDRRPSRRYLLGAIESHLYLPLVVR